jgi:hypothetical protein
MDGGDGIGRIFLPTACLLHYHYRHCCGQAGNATARETSTARETLRVAPCGLSTAECMCLYERVMLGIVAECREIAMKRLQICPRATGSASDFAGLKVFIMCYADTDLRFL